MLLDAMGRLDARLIRRGPEDVPYLWRAYLSPAGGDVGMFLHRFVSSDAQELHCHPWAVSYSFILRGRYLEDRTHSLAIDFDARTATLDGSTRRVKEFGPGDVNVIRAGTFHRIDLLTPDVWTFFVHGPRVQDWGFVPMNVFAEPVPMRLMEGHTRNRLPKENVI